MAAQVLSPTALLVAHGAEIGDFSCMSVHVFFKLEQLICFVITISTPVLVQALVVVYTCHHSIILYKTFSTQLTCVGIVLCMDRFPVVL